MSKKSQFLFSFLAFCILCCAIYLTIALISPPAPLPVDAPATEFSAGRAMQDLEESASGIAYEINQMYLEVPSDFGSWDTIRDIDNNWKLHTNFQQRQIDIWDAKRLQVGTPWVVAEAPYRSTTSGPVVRFEFWPRTAGPKTYAYRYIVMPSALSAPTDRPAPMFRGDVLLKGALAELCLWPGTATLKNPYYSLTQHSAMSKEFQEEIKELWKLDQDRGQTAILYERSSPRRWRHLRASWR